MEIYDYITCARAARGQPRQKRAPDTAQLFMDPANDYSLRAFDLLALRPGIH